jgi:hypothetical protein
MIGQAPGDRPADPRRNARRPVLVVQEVGARRALHQIDAELARDVADDQE